MRPFLCLCSATRSTSGATEGKGGVVMSMWFLVGIESSDGIWALTPWWPPPSVLWPTGEITEGSGWMERMKRPLCGKEITLPHYKHLNYGAFATGSVHHLLYFGPPGLLLGRCSPLFFYPILYGHLHDWKKDKNQNNIKSEKSRNENVASFFKLHKWPRSRQRNPPGVVYSVVEKIGVGTRIMFISCHGKSLSFICRWQRIRFKLV